MIPDWLKLAILGLGIVAVTVSAAAPSPPRYETRVFRELRYMDGQFVDRPAPPFRLYDLNGNIIDLSAMRGKVIFLNLWATWCKPCRDELPSMVRLAQALAPEKDAFEMIAVSWDDDMDDLSSFLSSLPAVPRSMTIAVDRDGELTRQLGTRKLPETYVIDADGQIVARFQNLRDWDDQHAVRLFTALIRSSR